MKRAAVFAHYDKDNIIDDYIIYYMKHLKKLCEKVIFVSCCPLDTFELHKLDNIADFAIAELHREYDFGSYKRGFLYLKRNNFLGNIDSLIFANDSCYGPLFPLENVFEVMEKENYDFWGITRNRFGTRKKNNDFVLCKREHIQSYFFVINADIYNSGLFSNFLENVKQEEFKNDIIINYEIGLSELLTSYGFTSGFYIKDFYNVNNATILKWRQLAKKSPFIKCNLLRQVYAGITAVDDWEKVLQKNTNYPTELIKKNLQRTGIIRTKITNIPFWLKRLIYDILSYMPNSIRRICSICIGRLLEVISVLKKR